MSNVDWTDLARRLGSLERAGSQYGSSTMARAAVELLLGPELIRSAVDHYVSGAPGSELARHVLWLLHPWSAMERCHEIYLTSPDLDDRRAAVELLRVVADRRALPWVAIYLSDPDEIIQAWAAGIVDQLLFSSLIEEEECAELLGVMKEHANERVRETHASVAGFLAEREGPAEVR
jgi:hypothetical protein